jgi:uncharacterized protein
MHIEFLVFYFFLYSFCGWIIESAYISWRTRRPVNSGFLHGPFVPLYGFGAVAIITADFYLQDFTPLALRLVVFVLLATALEYYTGLLLEELLELRLWDYSHLPLNFGGKVCLLYSFCWMGLSYVLLAWAHPFARRIEQVVAPGYIMIANRMIGLYLLIDLVHSIRSIRRFKTVLATLQNKYLIITTQRINDLLASIRREVSSFPNLMNYLNATIAQNVKESFKKSVREAVAEERLVPVNTKKTAAVMPEKEYFDIVGDIINNEEFQKLKFFKHHDSSIYDHALAVSYLAYKYCKKNNLDYVSAARGGLLHDFFLYDWRNGKMDNGEKVTLHAFKHPSIALSNAKKHFAVTEIEADIIVNHMWPLTFVIPRYKESYIVNFIDKYSASKEMFASITRNQST